MKADVFISKTESGGVEISVVRQGLSSGAAHKYEGVDKAKAVLLAFGFDEALVVRQLNTFSETAPSVLLRFPPVDIADDVLESREFKAASFRAA
jgi:hypothetical protein